MAKKKNTFETINTIKCRDCEHSFDPDHSNLSLTDGHPMLTNCRFTKYKVFYNLVEVKCNNSKQKK